MGLFSPIQSLLGLANAWSSNQTFNGTNNTAPNQTAAGSTSLMTQSLTDARAGVIYNLIQASDVSASNQTYVFGTGITLPAGTYVFRGSIIADTASTTSGININCLQTSGTAVTGFASNHGWSSTTQQSAGYYSMTVPTAGQFRNGINWWYALGGYADAPNKTVFSETQGTVTVATGGGTFTFEVAQRTAVDASNPVYLRANSFIAFTKIS